MSVQRSPSPEVARLASVRVRTRFSPAPAIRHTLQLQLMRNAATRRAPSQMPVRPSNSKPKRNQNSACR
jgi:hypothetical protein